jgi:succinate dehydrogenase / fumarate reductase cytochrome b subunit
MVHVMCQYFTTSIGRKQVMALTGLLLCGFLVAHMLGNFLILVGPSQFNIYAHKLISLGPLLYLAEAGLSAIFLAHLGLAVKLTLENHAARGQKYYVKTRTGRGETLMSATMPYTGLVLLIFIITHLIHFKFGPYYSTIVDGVTMRDLYKTVADYFKDPLNTLWYVFAMVCAAFHTAHGFSSAFQSFGWNHPAWFPKIKSLGLIYALIVGGGFSFIAIWTHFYG